MRILGIETSCDETAVCLIEASGSGPVDFKYEILGNALISQAKMHAEYGGVFPTLAKREHAKNLVPLTSQILKDSKAIEPSGHNSVIPPERFDEIEKLLAREPELDAYLSLFLAQHKVPAIDAIAVTSGPGLEPALWVGINFARALSIAWDKPIVAVNHMEGHIMLSMMESGRLAKSEFPVLALLISGGHTELVLSKKWMEYEMIGQTRDDAVGEAYDKAARMIGLDYPGGPEISRMADLARAENLRADFKLPRPMMQEDNYDFSFAGLKTAVRKIVEARGELDDDFRKKMSREFEEAAADVLVTKTLKAVDAYGAGTVVIGGGVSANIFIRSRLTEALEKVGGTSLLVPPAELATDNAIMIALTGYFYAQKDIFADPALLTARGNLKLA